ncbi:PrgH/EprH family type III secretion apparatus protein [Obesumbacterium proteus]|uniref:PrgH/EprH family type III secretion apparatus protein n=1 Tax=Obesumbacterium proteus TaxID=82983 RepID=UPI00242CEDC2|nr:PrgH/EprH family type III secretion apparatus protein [Obesumbacterium proteus]
MEINTSSTNKVVIRLLNSPLRGCEFILSPGRTLFVVGQRSDFVTHDSIPELPEETLFIPLEQGGVNFEILFEENLLESITLRELGEGEINAQQQVAFNTLLHAGALMFALRRENEDWSVEILGSSGVELPKDKIKLKRFKPAIIALAAMSVLLIGGFLLWDSPQEQAVELGGLLGGENQRFEIIYGHNDVFYVIAANSRDAIWAQQVIARGDYQEPAKVINPEQENEHVTRWLADNYPTLSYYRLQMDNPRQAQLWISSQRSTLSKEESSKLSQKLMALLPYTDRVDIVSMNDTMAVNQAEHELQRQALPYSRSYQADGVTFVIQGALDDAELLRARQLVDAYYSQWGGRYVQFAIELKDDWLKGHSFQYGDQGYVKISPRHWYFPKPL